jgi:endonuclease YncB( thermonuclease family)
MPEPLDLNHRYLPDCRSFSSRADFSKRERGLQERGVIHKRSRNCFGKSLRAAVAPYSSIFVNGMGGWAPLVVAVVVSGSALDVRAQDTLSHCGTVAMPAGRVVRVIDGRSFVLDDGREIRLASVEVPVAADAAGAASQAALASMVVGQSVALRGASDSPDRYGRIVAYATAGPARAATAAGDRSKPSIAHAMLAEGHARVAAQVDDPECAKELRLHERVARFAKIGLWNSPQYAIIQARNLTGLVAEQGRFAIVEGKVLSVRESGRTIYANFGRRWSQALTVTISKRQERMFAGSGLRPKDLENRQVQVRGWVEVRRGPQIEATRPEQIEFVD